MSSVGNNIKVATSTLGTGSSLQLGSAANGCQGFAAGGIHDGAVVQYELVEGVAWERNQGTYSVGDQTVTRGTPSESSNGGAQISLNGGGSVAIVFTAEQFRSIDTDRWFFMGRG